MQNRHHFFTALRSEAGGGRLATQPLIGFIKGLLRGLDAKISADKLSLLYSNDLVDCINDFDREKIREQASQFKM